jgi:hypothetical protein
MTPATVSYTIISFSRTSLLHVVTQSGTAFIHHFDLRSTVSAPARDAV